MVKKIELNFENTEGAFAYKSDRELKRAAFLFSMMGNRTLLRIGLFLIPNCIRLRIPPVKSLVRNTIFRQFVGGETLEQATGLMDLFARYGVETVIDYGVEGKTEGDAAYDEAADAFIRVIRHAAAGRKFSFMSIKATAFMRMELMEKMDALMRRDGSEITQAYSAAVSMLATDERAEWERATGRFEKICREGFENRVGVWVDAEESWLQHPVDALALQMMEKYNREQAIIYNTVQLYRHDRLEFLKYSHRHASSRGFVLGVKLVRGAYMEKERSLAVSNGYPSPIQPDKSASDRDYDAAVEYCLRHIGEVSVVVATHNEQSSIRAAESMVKAGMEPGDKRVFFAQLMGMSDNITFNLARQGFNAQKLVPFGPIGEVIPYLMRRAQENSSVEGQTGRELNLIRKEIRRRADGKRK